MALPLPDLDDRRWVDLVDEGRALIPFYAPDWTDHNIHDPGITLIELFALIAEMEIYRVNRVPDTHRRRFLRLVGVELLPPSGARTALAFGLEEDASQVRLPAHTELQSDGASRPRTSFRTLRALTVMPGKIEAIQAWDGHEFTDLTRQWKRGETIAPFGSDPCPGTAFYLGFESHGDWKPSAQLSLHFAPTGTDEGERERLLEEERAVEEACRPPEGLVTCNANSEPSPTEEPRGPFLHHSVHLVWEMYSKTGVWVELGPDRVDDETRALTMSGTVVITIPDQGLENQIGQVEYELVYLRCRFVAGTYDAAPELRALLFNGVEAEQTIPVVSLTWPISASASVVGSADPGQRASFDMVLEPKPTGQTLYEQSLSGQNGMIDCVLCSDAGGSALNRAPVLLTSPAGEIGSELTDKHGRVTFTLPDIQPRQYTLRVFALGKEFNLQVNYSPADPLKLVLKMKLVLAIQKIDFTAAGTPWFHVLNYVAPSAPGAPKIEVAAVAIGSGSGLPNQEITLPESAVADSSLRLLSLEESGWRWWTKQIDFVTSDRDDAHYLLEADTGRLIFGDGEHGRVVPAAVPLVAAYHATDGRAGNLPAKTYFEIVDNAHNRKTIPDLDDVRDSFDSTSIINPLAADGGAPSEDLVEATSRAFDLVTQPYRAVTLRDYEVLALGTPGTRLARVAARANLHPAFPCLKAPGIITLIIVPYLPENRPTPSRELRGRVAAYLHRRRVLGTRVEVVGPEYTEVSVRARVRACAGTSRSRLAGAIRDALDDLFHPLTGGPRNESLPETERADRPDLAKREEIGWPFGRDVYRSEVLQVIDETDGTDHVLSLEFTVHGGGCTCGNVCISSNGLVASGTHEIEVV